LGFDASHPVVLVIGGSQGAGSINQSLRDETSAISDSRVQWMWQCGAGYFERYKGCSTALLEQVQISPFIDDMTKAYRAADLVICRAGAMSIAELMFLGKPAILVPSPNVAADHQTINAKTIVEASAGILLEDDNLDQLVSKALAILDRPKELDLLSQNIKKLSRPNATIDIADQIVSLIDSK